MRNNVQWFACIVLVMAIVDMAGGQCVSGELDTQKELRKNSLKSLQPLSFADLAEDSPLNNVWMIMYSFEKTTFEATTYRCTRSRTVDYPKHDGSSWLVDITNYRTAGILDVRQILFINAKRHPDRYKLTHGYFVDVGKGLELPISSTIDFVVANQEVFFPGSEVLTPRVMVSGPYWKRSEYGEKVIGLLKRPEDGGKLSQGYHTGFRARHILCASETGIDLISPNLSRPLGKMDELKEEMERKTEECKSAIQIGPAYFEKGKELNEVGIAGLSLGEARRNIVFRTVAEKDKSEKTYLWTGLRPISPFDAMVLIEAISDRFVGQKSISWAVGLSDDEFLSGPTVTLDNGSLYPLAPTDPPVGALLVFYGPKVP